MNILIDIGNSRVKWACEANGNLTLHTALLHIASPDLPGFKNLEGLTETPFVNWQTQLFHTWQTLETPKKLIISSVAQQTVLETIVNLAIQLWENVKIATPNSKDTLLGVKNSYFQPEKLGVDRWLCLLAAHYFYPNTAAWIIDCGTAITVDFLNADGEHQGGLISPGLTLMKKSLLQNTAALNFSAQTFELGLANFTEAAIFSGTVYAAVGLIEQALKTQTTEVVILLTGGDAELVSQQLQQPLIIEPDLVLKGLSIFSHLDL